MYEGPFEKEVELSDKNTGSDIQVREWNSMASLCGESEKLSYFCAFYPANLVHATLILFCV